MAKKAAPKKAAPKKAAPKKAAPKKAAAKKAKENTEVKNNLTIANPFTLLIDRKYVEDKLKLGSYNNEIKEPYINER